MESVFARELARRRNRRPWPWRTIWRAMRKLLVMSGVGLAAWGYLKREPTAINAIRQVPLLGQAVAPDARQLERVRVSVHRVVMLEEKLVISVDVTNTSEKRRLRCSGWNAYYEAILEDAAGNACTQRVDNIGIAMLRLSRQTVPSPPPVGVLIEPGKTLRFAMLFDLPYRDLDYLSLTLPGGELEETSDMEFRIDRGQIEGLDSPLGDVDLADLGYDPEEEWKNVMNEILRQKSP